MKTIKTVKTINAMKTMKTNAMFSPSRATPILLPFFDRNGQRAKAGE